MLVLQSDANEMNEYIIYLFTISVDGNYLAVGSRDNSIYIHQVSEGGNKYSRLGRCTVSDVFLIYQDFDNLFTADDK